jgi:hypothetical protein
LSWRRGGQRAAGAAFYVNRAFKQPFFTFLVAFTVMCSGITSAGAPAIAFSGDYFKEFIDLPVVVVSLGVHRRGRGDQRHRHLRVGQDERAVHLHRGGRAAAHRRHWTGGAGHRPGRLLAQPRVLG